LELQIQLIVLDLLWHVVRMDDDHGLFNGPVHLCAIVSGLITSVESATDDGNNNQANVDDNGRNIVYGECQKGG
jgi:hypothetical protein